MAGFASQRFARGIQPGHVFGKLALMHVLVAGCAIERTEVVDGGFEAAGGFVALIASHGNVAAGKWEAALLVVA